MAQLGVEGKEQRSYKDNLIFNRLSCVSTKSPEKIDVGIQFWTMESHTTQKIAAFCNRL